MWPGKKSGGFTMGQQQEEKVGFQLYKANLGLERNGADREEWDPSRQHDTGLRVLRTKGAYTQPIRAGGVQQCSQPSEKRACNSFILFDIQRCTRYFLFMVVILIEYSQFLNTF